MEERVVIMFSTRRGRIIIKSSTRRERVKISSIRERITGRERVNLNTGKPQYSGHLWAMKIDHYKEVASL